MTNDYQSQITDFPAPPNDYKWCPLKWWAASSLGVISCSVCDGPRCAWWDAEREKCGVLPER